MERYFYLIVFLLASVAGLAQEEVDSVLLSNSVSWRYRSDSIANGYSKEMDKLALQRSASLKQVSHATSLNPYGLRMVLPPTFYSSSVLQQFAVTNAEATADHNLAYMYMLNDALAQMYVDNPEVVEQIDDQVEKAGTLREDVDVSLTTDTKLSDKVVTVDLGADLDDEVELVTRKPNFWKFSGSGSLKFSQNYFSENWYQGGENNYAFLGLLTLKANYDNMRNVQWENTLEARLGFQTTGESDQYHSMKPTDNLLRLTSKLGYKAYKTLFYTTQVQAYTQMVPLYETNKDVLVTDFLSPLNLTVSVGLDYKFATKNNRFNGSVYLAPCSYNMRYVRDLDLSKRYGIDEGCHAYHNFGPSITVKTYWQIAKNISWDSRIYWISNFDYTNIEWENTFKFTVNKYISASLYVYPKFDDTNWKTNKEEHNYLMLKEWFSLGLDYNW